VNIGAKQSALATAREIILRTKTANVVGEWGSFGGLFKAPGRDHLLVSSIDGVGTKLKVAVSAGRHDTVGQDIVNHCVNDILVHGATPLFFLDYIGAARLRPGMIVQLIKGISEACRENGCALIGGETAELPGLYPDGEYDLVGTIVGAVERKRLITGRTIRPGDVLIGLPSSGLHTNGYSLARAVIFRKAQLHIDDKFPGTRRSVEDVLLAVHKSYLKPVLRLMKRVTVRGMAHITGGGFQDNLPRVLPRNVRAVVDRAAWTPPPVFQFIQDAGGVARDEMYRVFNMGIGMIVIVRPRDVKTALRTLTQAGERPHIIGRIERGKRGAKLIN
jgi:phosphoribosylformylglycinamidine cyclo-ligase